MSNRTVKEQYEIKAELKLGYKSWLGQKIPLQIMVVQHRVVTAGTV